MSSHQITVGVDIAKRKFDAVRLENGKYKHKTFDNSADGFATLITWLLTFGEIKPLICMEATGAYSIPLAEFLVNSGHSVSVVNPAKIKAFAKSELSRLKTDKADAKLIARYALEKQPSLLDTTTAQYDWTASLAATHRASVRDTPNGTKPLGYRQSCHNRIHQNPADPSG